MTPERLTTLLDRHVAALVLYARQWCATAEDVVQEAFLKLVRRRPSPDNPVAWLYRVVRNGAISAARAEHRRSKHEARAALQSSAWFVPSIDGELDAERATDALRQIPLEQREVVVAHLWSELTFEEIGELIGASSSTAHRLYQAGLRALRERLHLPCPNQLKTR